MASASQMLLFCFVFSVSIDTLGGVVYFATRQKRFHVSVEFLSPHRYQSDFISDIVVRLVRFVTVL